MLTHVKILNLVTAAPAGMIEPSISLGIVVNSGEFDRAIFALFFAYLRMVDHNLALAETKGRPRQELARISRVIDFRALMFDDVSLRLGPARWASHCTTS